MSAEGEIDLKIIYFLSPEGKFENIYTQWSLLDILKQKLNLNFLKLHLENLYIYGEVEGWVVGGRVYGYHMTYFIFLIARFFAMIPKPIPIQPRTNINIPICMYCSIW